MNWHNVAIFWTVINGILALMFLIAAASDQMKEEPKEQHSFAVIARTLIGLWLLLTTLLVGGVI